MTGKLREQNKLNRWGKNTCQSRHPGGILRSRLRKRKGTLFPFALAAGWRAINKRISQSVFSLLAIDIVMLVTDYIVHMKRLKMGSPDHISISHGGSRGSRTSYQLRGVSSALSRSNHPIKISAYSWYKGKIFLSPSPFFPLLPISGSFLHSSNFPTSTQHSKKRRSSWYAKINKPHLLKMGTSEKENERSYQTLDVSIEQAHPINPKKTSLFLHHDGQVTFLQQALDRYQCGLLPQVSLRRSTQDPGLQCSTDAYHVRTSSPALARWLRAIASFHQLSQQQHFILRCWALQLQCCEIGHWEHAGHFVLELWNHFHSSLAPLSPGRDHLQCLWPLPEGAQHNPPAVAEAQFYQAPHAGPTRRSSPRPAYQPCYDEQSSCCPRASCYHSFDIYSCCQPRWS